MTSHLHVVQAVDPLRGGGLGSAAIGLHRAMRAVGRTSTLLTTKTEGQLGLPADIEAFQRRGPDKAFYSPELRDAAEDAIGEDTIVHQHGFYVYPNLTVPRLADRADRPFVYHPHGMLEPWALNRSRRIKAAARLLFEHRNFRNASMWRALTDVEADQIRREGVTAPIVVAPNGVDTAHFAPARSKAEEPTALFLGRLHPKKGLPMLLEAWHRAGAQERGWSLVIAGPDELGHRSTLERMTADLGLGSSVSFLGEVVGPARQALMRSAWLLVLPSYSEGFPLSVIEAMACAVPVVATEHCHILGIADEDAGVVCGADVAGIADSLSTMFELDSSELDAIGKNGRALVEREYTWPTVAATVLEACDDHLG